jgi:hypothetical protein
MKLTKTKLKQIIKEELQSLKEGEMTHVGDDATHEDDMTAGEYYVSYVMGLPYNSPDFDPIAGTLDRFSADITTVLDAEIQPKDILAFVQQVLGDAQSTEVIDV